MKKINLESQSGTFKRILELKEGEEIKIIFYCCGEKIEKIFKNIRELKGGAK